METIGILDVDLLAGKQKRFPNLAAMKISAWYKEKGHIVSLVPNYEAIGDFHKIYACCAFTASAPSMSLSLRQLPHVKYGGTGFFFDDAPPLPPEIEHHFPDYNLYEPWSYNSEQDAFYLYTAASVGFLTRGCFRHCPFCVIQKYNKVEPASPLEEFYDHSRQRVCLLDDNVLGCPTRRNLLEHLVTTCEADKTQWEFKQGIDMRLMKPEIAAFFGSPSHHGEVIFAFDLIKEAEGIRRGLRNFRSVLPTKGAKAYVLSGFDGQDELEIASMFRRLEVLWEYRCLGYIMRHEKHKEANPVVRDMFTHLAAWVNQPQFQRKLSFREFVTLAAKTSPRMHRSADNFERHYPEVAKRFFDSKYSKQPQAF